MEPRSSSLIWDKEGRRPGPYVRKDGDHPELPFPPHIEEEEIADGEDPSVDEVVAIPETDSEKILKTAQEVGSTAASGSIEISDSSVAA